MLGGDGRVDGAGLGGLAGGVLAESIRGARRRGNQGMKRAATMAVAVAVDG